MDEIISYFNYALPRGLLTNQDEFNLFFVFRGINDVVEYTGTSPTFSFTKCDLAISLIDSNPVIDGALVKMMNDAPYGIPYHQIEPIVSTYAFSSSTQ